MKNEKTERLVRKDSRQSTQSLENTTTAELVSSVSSSTRRLKSVSFPPTHEQLITATHIIPRPSFTEIQTLYYTNDEILHMKRIYQKRIDVHVRKKVERGIKEFGSKIKEKMKRNVDDDLSVECIVNAGVNLDVSSSKSEEYYHNHITKRSNGSTKMGGVIERASCTLPSMITLLL